MLALMTSLALTVATPLPEDLPRKPALPVRLVEGNIWLINLYVDENGAVKLDNNEYSDGSALAKVLKAEFERYLEETKDMTPTPKARVIIHADRRTKYNDFFGVVKLCQLSGFTKLQMRAWKKDR